jgi:hypothetical protein
MPSVYSRELQVVGYLDDDAFLRCPGCARPDQRDTPIYENTTPYCDETCDYCGRTLLSNELSVQGYHFQRTANGVCVYRRGKQVGVRVGEYPADTAAALVLLERLNLG